MPTFQYKAKNQSGEVVTGTLAAGDRRLALVQLGRMGYFPLAVDVASTRAAGKKEPRTWGSGVGPRDVMLFTQQLGTLLRSGMSLSQALGTLGRRTQKKALADVINQLRGDIVQGETLSDSLAKHPKLFSRFYVNLTRAGEASGKLEDILVRLTRHYEQMVDLREKIITALIYPLLVVLVGIGTIAFFMMVMVPKFATMFQSIGRTLPLPTRILIGCSDAFVHYWWIGVLVIVVAVLLYRQRARTPEGRLALDALKLRVPVLGQVVTNGAFTHFARTLATLLENGVPVLNALEIVEDTMTNQVIARELREARTRVTDGTSISQPLAKGKVFPPLLLDMLAVGEESGAVVPALKNIADTYEQDLARTLKILTTLLEPAIIIVMALMVGGIVLSVLTAVFDITAGLSH